MPPQALREVEGVAQDTVGTTPRENGSLKNHLCIRAHAKAAAELRILPLGVLTHHPEVDVAWFAVTYRGRDSG